MTEEHESLDGEGYESFDGEETEVFLTWRASRPLPFKGRDRVGMGQGSRIRGMKGGPLKKGSNGTQG